LPIQANRPGLLLLNEADQFPGMSHPDRRQPLFQRPRDLVVRQLQRVNRGRQPGVLPAQAARTVRRARHGERQARPGDRLVVAVLCFCFGSKVRRASPLPTRHVRMMLHLVGEPHDPPDRILALVLAPEREMSVDRIAVLWVELPELGVQEAR